MFQLLHLFGWIKTMSFNFDFDIFSYHRISHVSQAQTNKNEKYQIANSEKQKKCVLYEYCTYALRIHYTHSEDIAG